MKQKLLTACALLVLCLATFMITAQAGQTQLVTTHPSTSLQPPEPASTDFASLEQDERIARTCALKPPIERTTPPALPPVTPTRLTLSRFRQQENPLNRTVGDPPNPSNALRVDNYQPRESIALAHPTNYGERFVLDLYGRTVNYPPIVVIHETVFSARSAINLFQTPHYRDSQQVSYHALIKRDGEIVYLVPPDKRAFGAGNSVFASGNGVETVKTHPDYPPSVNNFAYHISLETPRDGYNNRNRHSGYTQAQYQSLTWLVAKTGVPDFRITTHKGVDRSGLRRDPRNFNEQTFFRLLQAQPRTNEIIIGCIPPSS